MDYFPARAFRNFSVSRVISLRIDLTSSFPSSDVDQITLSFCGQAGDPFILSVVVKTMCTELRG